MASNSPTGGAPEPEPQPKKGKRTTCGYCDCILDQEGDIITMGKSAKEFRALRENEETRINRISALEAEVADLKAKLEAAAKKPEPPAPGKTQGTKSVLDYVTGR
jgi:predicted  nucleic acid-binding Zn-ribbon protein